MRYINHINIPQHPIGLREYFKFMPQVPDEIADDIVLNDVLLRIQFAPNDSAHQVKVSLRSEAAKDQRVFFLDIYDILLVNNDIDRDFILETLDEAHENIERVFEGFITDKARELFDVVNKNDA